MIWLSQMPQVFIVIGVTIYAPTLLWWILVTRPRERKLELQRKRNGLFWRIRDLEKDIYGKWRS
jgi:hypothetical protein